MEKKVVYTFELGTFWSFLDINEQRGSFWDSEKYTTCLCELHTFTDKNPKFSYCILLDMIEQGVTEEKVY